MHFSSAVFFIALFDITFLGPMHFPTSLFWAIVLFKSENPKYHGYKHFYQLILSGAPVTANVMSRLSIACYAANQTIIFVPLQDCKTDPIVLAHL